MNGVRFIYGFFIGVILLIFGAFYGAYFAFPYPDMPPEEAAMHRLHLSVSKWSLLGGVVLVVASIAVGIMKAVCKALTSSLSKVLVGVAFLISGFLYGSHVALPLPNPPPQGLQWVGHVLVSITLLLAGLGLLIMSIFGKLLPNKALHRTSR